MREIACSLHAHLQEGVRSQEDAATERHRLCQLLDCGMAYCHHVEGIQGTGERIFKEFHWRQSPIMLQLWEENCEFITENITKLFVKSHG